MSQVIFKLPENKPPFIGVLFESEQEARLNSYFVDEHKNLEYEMLAEWMGSKLAIRFSNCDSKLLFHWYKDLECNARDFKAWRVYSHLKINFGHCFLKDGKHTIVRTEKGNLYVLKVRSFYTG